MNSPVRAETGPVEPAASPDTDPPASAPGPDPAEHPLVKQAIDLFKARIVDVQPKRD